MLNHDTSFGDSTFVDRTEVKERKMHIEGRYLYLSGGAIHIITPTEWQMPSNCDTSNGTHVSDNQTTVLHKAWCVQL